MIQIITTNPRVQAQNSSLTNKKECHFYQIGQCHFPLKCIFSHSGQPRGYCNNYCVRCAEAGNSQSSNKPDSHEHTTPNTTSKSSLDEKKVISGLSGDSNKSKKENGKQKKNEELDLEKACNVCLSEKKDHAFVPCGHVALCGSCAKETSKLQGKCMLCRNDFKFVLKIYN